MTLWDKGGETDQAVLSFSAGSEYLLDQRLVPYDCLASIAHARALEKANLLGREETARLVAGLERIRTLHAEGRFTIAREQEDCHTAIEEWLTAEIGPEGKKIHLGRSRNDQVLAAVRLYEKEALGQVRVSLGQWQEALSSAMRESGTIGMPGYTHVRRAMPTTVGTWLGAFSDGIDDCNRVLGTVHGLIDQSPLGTGAGYGIPVFELDRNFSALSMGFDRVQQNPIYAQMSRGLFEGCILGALSMVMLVLNRLASDLMLFTTSEFGFVVLPANLCTGSSIMPQKKNPDVLELVRASYHIVIAEEFKVKSLVGNLMSGYQRDLGLTKEPVFRSFDATLEALGMMTKVVGALRVDAEACSRALSSEVYATEEAYRLVRKGMSFRDAYRRVGRKYAGD